MRNYAQPLRILERAAAAWAALVLVGCASVAPPLEPASTPPAPVASVAVEPPAPAPAPPAPSPPAAAPRRAEIAVIVDTSAPSHAEVAAEIVAALPPRLYRVTQHASDTPSETLTALRARPVTIVAVGADAVARARAELPDKPLVFCQVLAYQDLVATGGPIWGVRPVPPLSLQLAGWKSVDPTLRTIALIVSDPTAALAAEAQRAARELAADLLVETSSSDRETLYLFRRLAAEVDGLWLLPDSTALSPSALRELLGYAAARGVAVLTFSDALLRRGALLSATSVPADVAETVRVVVERVVTGRTADLPAMTPLSAAQLEVNQAVAATLGLPPVAAPRWVTREPD
jgi:putative ABC transport system substrate-binding protein